MKKKPYWQRLWIWRFEWVLCLVTIPLFYVSFLFSFIADVLDCPAVYSRRRAGIKYPRYFGYTKDNIKRIKKFYKL